MKKMAQIYLILRKKIKSLDFCHGFPLKAKNIEASLYIIIFIFGLGFVNFNHYMGTFLTPWNLLKLWKLKCFKYEKKVDHHVGTFEVTWKKIQKIEYLNLTIWLLKFIKILTLTYESTQGKFGEFMWCWYNFCLLYVLPMLKFVNCLIQLV